METIETPPSTSSAPASASTNNTGMAVLAYLGLLIIIPFLTDAKNEPFVKFHLKQGLVLLILEIASPVIVMVPVLGWILGLLIWPATVVFMILGIISAATGKTKELPLIGSFAKNFNF